MLLTFSFFFIQPIHVPICSFYRCIKINQSHSATETVIFGNGVNISAQDACTVPTLNMIVILDMDSNIYLYSGPVQVSLSICCTSV